MPKPKMYFQFELPSSVVEIVKSVCNDYTRRACAIRSGSVNGAVLARYIELNGIIDTAIAEIEVGIRMDMLRDIQKRRGYDFSPAAGCMAKNTYYKRKKKVIYCIAKSLELI